MTRPHQLYSALVSLLVGVGIASPLAGCTAVPGRDEAAAPAVVFTYPVDNQRDVPLGARLLISFSDPIALAAAGGCTVVGPNGNVDITSRVTGDGKTVAITSTVFEPGTTYEVHVGAASVENLAGGPLFRFTTRSDAPRAGAPSLTSVNGSDPGEPGAFRPIFETSTLQLVFSEPLDPRSVELEASTIALVNTVTGLDVPVTLLYDGIHVVLDPVDALTAGTAYELRLGDRLVDLAGDRLAPTSVTFVPVDSVGRGASRQMFRTRQEGDPGAAIARTDTPNAMEVAHPLIGEALGAVNPNTLETELGDPLALDGPIAFSIRKGQRLSSSGLDIKLAGSIPSGLTTGDIMIELLTDGGGRIYRNRYWPADTLPDNKRAPLLVDLSFDLAVYATDPTGNAVLAQTVLGVQLSGLALADEGALTIETLGALDIDLLGISTAPANISLDLLSDPGSTRFVDQQAPSLLTSMPRADTRDWVIDEGIELVFDEPIDIDRARAGGIRLRDASGSLVPSTLELHGSVVVVRPAAVLLGNHGYRVDLIDAADLAGNVMPPRSFAVATQTVVQTDVSLKVLAVYPGAPCSLTDASATRAGRCVGGGVGDDLYQQFALAANERIAVVFDQPARRQSLVLGKTCGTGSVRIERIDDSGACLEPVAGTLLVHQRDVSFMPDRRWQPGERYRLRLISGANATCDAGEVCGANGRAANFDPLAGTSGDDSGGPDLVVDFVGSAPTSSSTLVASAIPNADLNGSGEMEQGELLRDDNRVALRIAGTSGLIDNATFQGADCLPGTPGVEACMYVVGAIPAQLGERRDNCTLPDGSTVATCIPVAMTAQTMYSTSVAMRAGALGIGLDTETGMTMMRVRERPDGPLEGYIVDRNGTPTMVVALELYMDAPDMSLPIAQHDMRSKPLAVSLEGPLSFGLDGRFVMTLRNTADIPITVGINAPLGITGTVKLVVPAGEMRLQLMSRSLRGSLP